MRSKPFNFHVVQTHMGNEFTCFRTNTERSNIKFFKKKNLGIDQFTASYCLNLSKKAQYFRENFFSGESNNAGFEKKNNFKEKIANFFAKYEMKDIFNADECGFFFGQCPVKITWSLLINIRIGIVL